MLLEIFSHERLVREAHVLRYLLYALCRVLQQDTQLHHNVVVYQSLGVRRLTIFTVSERYLAVMHISWAYHPTLLSER